MAPRPWIPGPDHIEYLDERDPEEAAYDVIWGNFPLPTDDPDPEPDVPTTPLAS